MKKKGIFVALLLFVSLALSGVALAGDQQEQVTLEGKIICAKCALHEEGREECQNVLVVKSDDEEKHYYLAAGEASSEMGYVCTASKAVRVTGSVSEKDGKMWLAATEIVPAESEG